MIATTRLAPHVPAPVPARAAGETRRRLLDATLLALSRSGRRRLSLSEVALTAGVSRPTLYRYFPTKQDLLVALAEHEHQRFDDGMAAAIEGLEAEARLDAALRFMAAFQDAYGPQHFAELEPAFILDRMTQVLPASRAILALLVEERDRCRPSGRTGPSPDDVADLLVRITLSYVLIPATGGRQMLRALRIVAGVDGVPDSR